MSITFRHEEFSSLCVFHLGCKLSQKTDPYERLDTVFLRLGCDPPPLSGLRPSRNHWLKQPTPWSISPWSVSSSRYIVVSLRDLKTHCMIRDIPVYSEVLRSVLYQRSLTLLPLRTPVYHNSLQPHDYLVSTSRLKFPFIVVLLTCPPLMVDYLLLIVFLVLF